jgi:tRNA1(Val) A37 N6-methylase TrmN6
VATTEDAFLGGALRLRQPRHGYRAGLDAILLAAACPALAGSAAHVLDCGAGIGTVGLAVARRIADATVHLVERDPVLADLARANAAANALADRCRVATADLTLPLSQNAALAALAGRFDHVLANPPYNPHPRGTRAPDPHKDGSHAMPEGALDDWVRFAAAMLAEGGSLTVIHRPDALPDLLAACSRRFGGLNVLPLHPRAGQPASRILLQGIRGSRAGLSVLPGRILHQADSPAFTAEFDTILRHPTALRLAD